MCSLCVEIAKENMNIKEVAAAYIEFEVPVDHLTELMQIVDKHYGQEELTDEVIRILIQRRKAIM